MKVTEGVLLGTLMSIHILQRLSSDGFTGYQFKAAAHAYTYGRFRVACSPVPLIYVYGCGGKQQLERIPGEHAERPSLFSPLHILVNAFSHHSFIQER